MTQKLRWNAATNREESHPDVEAFVAEVHEVCRRHGLVFEGRENGGQMIHKMSAADADRELTFYGLASAAVYLPQE